MEFALVLPLFMLILMGILDFGWLFYNYVGVENCARNGARIACVEYKTVNYDSTKSIPIHGGVQEFDPNNTNANGFYKREYVVESIDGLGDFCNTEEKDIIDAIVFSKPKSVTLTKITLSYSYDVDNPGRINYNSDRNDLDDNGQPVLNTSRRSKGDVTVKVEGKLHVLTPVLGVFSDHMQFKLTSQSTYKVEKMADSSSTP